MMAAMHKFRQSGMGDCPLEERVKTSNTVFSSKFRDYISGGDSVLLYWYQLYLEHDLMESAACDMPEHTGSSSSAATPRSASGPNLSRAGGSGGSSGVATPRKGEWVRQKRKQETFLLGELA